MGLFTFSSSIFQELVRYENLAHAFIIFDFTFKRINFFSCGNL
jgi:hypothetical protein